MTYRNCERLDVHEPDRLREYCCCSGGGVKSMCPPEIQSDSSPGGPELVEIPPQKSSSDRSPPGLL